MTFPATILSADWAKDFGKRAVWAADVDARTIGRVPPRGGWTLGSLLDGAEQRVRRPVLVALDLVLGVPCAYFDRRVDVAGWDRSSNFVDWLPRAARSERFFDEVSNAREWSIARPFFSVPAGEGALRSFGETAGFDLLRDVDQQCGGKPVFAVSGIPGSVGSATRALWRELAPMLESERDFRVWPFEGELNRLLRDAPIIVAEMYPRIAYAIAVAPELPTRPKVPRKKSDRSEREEWVSRLRAAPWIHRFDVRIADEAAAISSEDDFDSLFTAAALLRCLVENVPLASDVVDARAEGGILGTDAVMWRDCAPALGTAKASRGGGSRRLHRARGEPIRNGGRAEEGRRMGDDSGDDVEEYVDCAGDTRTFRLRVYAEGRFLDAVEVRNGELNGLRFVMPVGLDGTPPWGEMRSRIRDRLARKHIVRDRAGKLHILGDVVRAQIHNDGEALPTVVVDDIVITWEELGELVLPYSGFGMRLTICAPGDE